VGTIALCEFARVTLNRLHVEEDHMRGAVP
jgi:hypothetical protein